MSTLHNTGDFTDLSDFIARAEPGDRYRETQPPHSVSDYLVTEVTEIRGHRAVVAQGAHTQHAWILGCYRTSSNPVTWWIDHGQIQRRIDAGTGPVIEHPWNAEPCARELFGAHQQATGR